ncbi:MAG: hypothetical protein AAB455_01740 [Patescibacteria group bacterium]
MTPEESLEAKRLEAKAAMEGPEWTAKREREEKVAQVTSERGQVEKSLSDLTRQKEALELEWVRLDDERKIMREKLAPVLERERQTEEAEAKLELEEAKATIPQDKQAVEKKRQVIQATRREVEQEKWVHQEKLWKVENVIETNTVKYRALLDQEDELKKRLNSLAI